jgi:xanthine dehydrogenase accessory factor
VIALLAQHAASRTPCALVTVVRSVPPTSARPGDKAVVSADGRLRGWVGGSCAEPLVRREALRAMARGAPCLVHIRPQEAAASEELDQGRWPGEVTAASSCPSGGSLDAFIEPQLPKPQLLVFGDSPAARPLIELGSLTGFRTCAIHPGARAEDHPRADLVLETLELSAAGPDMDSWAVVATMGHYDEDALQACLAHPGLDVALVASDRRAEAVREGLRRRGLDDVTLSRIRAPAGGVRGATQEEIALFALAELVAARRERRDGPSGDLRRQVDAAMRRFATDPVCGMAVDITPAAISTLHEGRRVYFCSAGCLEKFESPASRTVDTRGDLRHPG